MNFGGKITILYLSFVALIVTLVTLCYKQDVELVTDDYYAQEINFQEKLDATNNEKSLKTSIQHAVLKDEIILKADSSLFNEDFKGTITLFRPSNSKLDITYPMSFVNNQQVIQKNDLTHGAYKLQLSWVNNQTNYYKEEVIFID